MMLAKQINTSKLIAKRIELNSSMKRESGLDAVVVMIYVAMGPSAWVLNQRLLNGENE